MLHGFLRRTYYVPIILTGLLCGLRQTACFFFFFFFIVATYLPFVVLQWSNHPLPANMKEIYEIAKLAVVGGLTGVLSDRKRKRRVQLREAYPEKVIGLATAAEYRDDSTGAHLQRISRYAEVTARNLGLPAERVELNRLASTMHDIGKIGIPDRTLLNRGTLNDDETV